MQKEPQPDILGKDEAIRLFLAMIQSKLDDESYQIVDHWDASLVSIGIAKPGEPDILVYVTTLGQPEGCYGYECEIPSENPDEFPFQTVAEGDGVNFETMVEIIRKHLKIESSKNGVDF